MLFSRRPRLLCIYSVIVTILLTISICVKFGVNFDRSSIHLSPGEYLHVNLSLTSNTAVCRADDRLIIYILSTVINFQRRKVVRSTWASPLPGTCFVFILGKSPNIPAQTLIQKEKDQHRDIVQIDHVESYANVIYKEVGALQWSFHFYPSIPYLFKTDDDLIIDSILVSELAQVLTTNRINTTSYISKHRPTLNTDLVSGDSSSFFRGGWSMDSQPTLRVSKFAVSESVWPHPVLPLYCSGFGWLMSKNTRDKLVKASHVYPLTKVAWIGDVFTSGFLAKAAGVKCTGLAIDYEQTSSANCSCTMAQNPMLTVCSSTFHGGGGGDADTTKHKEYEKAWKIIRNRHDSIEKSSSNIDDC